MLFLILTKKLKSTVKLYKIRAEMLNKIKIFSVFESEKWTSMLNNYWIYHLLTPFLN